MSLLVDRRELLDRFRAGERQALEEVYRHYVSEVASFLQHGFVFSSRGRSLRFAGYRQPFDLDNALQETFSRAFKQSARLGYDGINSYRNYLFAIARNFVIDEVRSREVAMSPFIEASPELSSDQPEAKVLGGVAHAPERSAENDFLSRELEGLYSRFLKNLEAPEQAFFRARFEEQRTQLEVAAQLSLSHMQVRTREKKLRDRFLEFMQAQGYLSEYGGTQ